MEAGTTRRSARAFVARQPIFSEGLTVFAYELLFRSSLRNLCSAEDLERASPAVIASGTLLMDLRALGSGRPVFINVTRDVLLDGFVHLLPQESTVVELLETVKPDQEVLDACRELRRKGYRLALDDFVYREALEPLLELADFVKIDVLATDAAGREKIARRLGGGRTRLVAEKVESPEMLRETRELGYDLFQGYFFSRPVVISARDVPGHKLQLLAILRELQRPELDFAQLDAVIRRDLALCYKLLRFVNAAQHGLRQPIGSVRRALVLLGQNNIRKWASLVVLTMIGEDRPVELVRQALVRARFCESLAAGAGLPERADDLFLCGMFSLIDAVLGRPMAELLDALPVSEDVKAALVGASGPLAAVLVTVLDYERGRFEQVAGRIGAQDEGAVAGLYLNAVEWAVGCLPLTSPSV